MTKMSRKKDEMSGDGSGLGWSRNPGVDRIRVLCYIIYIILYIMLTPMISKWFFDI